MSVLRFLKRLFLLSTLLAAPLLAQSDGSGGAVAAGRNSPWNIAAGYSYVNMNLSGKPTADLNGITSSAMIDFNPRWGVTLDSSYVRAGRAPGSGHSSYILSALAGPVFVPIQNHNTRLLVRALGGVSLVDSSVQVNQLYFRGWLARFSWAVGTGIERKVSTPFAVRINVDYLRTRFMGPTATVQGLNGIRLSASLVYRFSPRREVR